MNRPKKQSTGKGFTDRSAARVPRPKPLLSPLSAGNRRGKKGNFRRQKRKIPAKNGKINSIVKPYEKQTCVLKNKQRYAKSGTVQAIYRKSRNKIPSAIALLFSLLFAVLFWRSTDHLPKAFAESPSSATDSEYFRTIEEDLKALEDSEFSSLLEQMTEEQRALFAEKDVWETVREMATGNYRFSFGSFAALLKTVLFATLGKYISLICTVVGVSVLTSLLASEKNGFCREEVGSVVFYAGYAVVLSLTLVAAFSVIGQAKEALLSVRDQAAVLFPLLLALLTASGATASAAAYQAAGAFLSTGILSLFSSVAFPLLSAMVLLSVFGHLSESIKTAHLFSLVKSVAKWLVMTTVAVYSLFLGMQGITAASHDGVSYKLLKYAVGNSVPLVGGTIKDGFDLLLAAGIEVKNALGYFALLLISALLFSAVVKLLLFSACLKAASGVLQPLGEEKTCGYLNDLSSVAEFAAGTVSAGVFLYIVTLFGFLASTAGMG